MRGNGRIIWCVSRSRDTGRLRPDCICYPQAELPNKISETVYEYSEVLYDQLTKYGPPALPGVGIPSLRETLEDHLPSFSKPPPPPPPTRYERIASWIKANRYGVGAGVAVAAVGLGLAYRRYPGHFNRWLTYPRGQPRRLARSRNGVRREAVGESWAIPNAAAQSDSTLT